jgi:hypothetical protein
MWMEISDINAKNIYITIFYLAPINFTFYKKNNLDKNFPYNGLEHDIYSMINEGSMLFLGDFNVRITTNQGIILSNDSNPNILWLDEDLFFTNR